MASHQTGVATLCEAELMRPSEPFEHVEHCAAQSETFWQNSPFALQRYGLSWWALQLPVVRFIVGSSSFRQFEQQVSVSEWRIRLI